MAKKPETKADPTHERRRVNLWLLTAQWGNATTLAGKLGHSGPSYISQMLSGLRPITVSALMLIGRLQRMHFMRTPFACYKLIVDSLLSLSYIYVHGQRGCCSTTQGD